MCAIFVPACEGCTDCQRRSEAHMRTPVVHPGKPCPLPIRPAGNAARPAGPAWPFDPFALLHPGSAAGRRSLFALVACCRSCRSAGPAPAAVVDPATLARRAAGHGRRHGPPWLPRCWPCNDHATQHATHHAAAASRRRGVRPMMQRLRRCSYRDAMHHHTRTPGSNTYGVALIATLVMRTRFP